MMTGYRLVSAMLLGTCVSAIAAGAGWAAEQPQERATVEEVVVTAQRRAESLQDVPITVNAIGGEQLKAAGVTGSADLGQLVPGLVFGKNISGGLPFIRGVGPVTSGQPGYESPTALYVDGVYKPSINQVVTGLRSVERIEVLKGPQGTLFGRNSAAGVINIITRDPEFAPRADVSLGYGSYQTVEGEFYGTTGISEDLAANLSLYGLNQAEGWGYNPFFRKEIFTQSTFVARGKLLWKPSDLTRVVLGASYDRAMGYQGIQGIAPGALGPDGVTRYTGRYTQPTNTSGVGKVETYGVDLHVEHDFGAFRINNILAYGYVDSWTAFDADGTAQQINEADPFIATDEAFTEEFHILSPADSRIQWIVGTFLMHEKIYSVFTNKSNRRPTRDIDMRMNTWSWSIFGQATIPVLTDTNLTLGARYTNDKKDYLYGSYDPTVAGRPLDPVAPTDCAPLEFRAGTCYGKNTWQDPSYRVSLDHRLSDNVLIFASYNRGFVAGAFNVTLPNATPVEPTINDAYEVGFKSDLFDRRARLNASAFYYDYKNLQVRATNGAQQLVFNAASSEVKGVDVDFDVFATDNLRFRGGVAYLDAHYKSFPGYILIVPRPTGGNQTVGTQDASGTKLPRSPRWSGNFGATYTIESSIGVFAANLNYSYNSGFDWEPGGQIVEGPYSIVNGSLSWTSPDEVYDIVITGNNITDTKHSAKKGRSNTSDSYVPSAPRTFMIRATRHF